MSAFGLSVGYSLTSATLAVANKWALVRFPYSGTLTLLQFAFASGSVRLLKAFNVLEADALSFKKIRAFTPAVIMFYVTVAANLRLLSQATVDTFIVARSVTPLLTQLGETLFFKKEKAPTRKQLFSLCIIAVGATGYALNNSRALKDREVVFWGLLYVFCVSADMLIVKKVVTDVELKPWGYVYYNNVLALVLYPGWVLITGEAKKIHSDKAFEVLIASRATFLPVFLSCAVGLGISFFGLNTRRALSATAFTVLGAACKFVSIIVNVLSWNRHAPLIALPWLCLALTGSILYQQASTSRKAVLPLKHQDDLGIGGVRRTK